MLALTSSDLISLGLSLRLAGTTTLILFIIGIPLANWLATTQCKLKACFEAAVALPLVLPPTVIGFYLLMALGNQGIVGKLWYIITGGTPAFSFSGLVIGSVLYSFPFVVQPLQTAFEAIEKYPLELAATLGATQLDSFFTVKLPLAKRGLLTAAVLGFTHTLGEFGIVLMIGGNIPNRTQLISIDIYNHVESLQYHQANNVALVLLGFSFITLVVLYGFNHRSVRLKL